MTDTMTDTTIESAPPSERFDIRRRRAWQVAVGGLVVLLVAVRLFGDDGVWETWLTLFVSVLLQSLPFLVLGVVVSGLIAGFVTPGLLERIAPKSEHGSVAVATCAGLLLPGCECGSVPISDRLMRGGVAPAAALAFMLAAPAINPVVLVSTAVAFPGRPEMVLARFLASFTVALGIGMLWTRRNSSAALKRASEGINLEETRTETFVGTVVHDFLHAGGFLVVGAAAAAAIQAFVPQEILATLGSAPVIAVLGMALLAIVLSICSEADAFFAASFAQVSPTAQLAFMVTGPVVDLKLVSMQAGVFGTRFASRFAPATVVAAIFASVLFGWLLL
ncbi:MAG: permease [Acidimicrobiales bacterium]